jgi:hypothetical protein
MGRFKNPETLLEVGIYFQSLTQPQTNTPSNHSPYASGSTPRHDHDHPMSGAELSLPTLNILDLELLHNYVTSTAFTLHTDPALKILWRIDVPQIGFQYDFVMRGILALSALHLARFKPDKSEFYIAHAMQQHQIGLRMATSVLQEVTDQNCTGVWVFSALTLFFTLASPRGASDFLLIGENGISDWLFLVKGTGFIIDNSEKQLAKGPLGPMFLAGKRRSQLRRQILNEASINDDPLTELQNRITESDTDRMVVPAYLSAIEVLRVSFVFIFASGPPGYETGDVFYWVFRVTDEYLQLLKMQTQESMAILAYFCVVLRRLDSQWWMEGWSTHLIAKIWNLLDEEHRYAMKRLPKTKNPHSRN